MAARKGYHCVFVMPDKIAPEKIDLLRAYGAEVVVCPTRWPPNIPIRTTRFGSLVGEIHGAFKPNQYGNPANPPAHERRQVPRYGVRQPGGSPTSWPASAPAGPSPEWGVISSRRTPVSGSWVPILRDRCIPGASGRPYLVEGIGEDLARHLRFRRCRMMSSWSATAIPSSPLAVVDSGGRHPGRRINGHGCLGCSSGGPTPGPDDVVVVLIPDSGRGYLSKLYNDGWMADSASCVREVNRWAR